MPVTRTNIHHHGSKFLDYTWNKQTGTGKELL